MSSAHRFILCCMMVLLPLQGYGAVMKYACHPAGVAESHCQEAEAAPQAVEDHHCHHEGHDATPEKQPAKSTACADSLCCHLSGIPAMALPALPAFTAGNAYNLFPFHPHPSHIPEQPQRPPLA